MIAAVFLLLCCSQEPGGPPRSAALERPGPLATEFLAPPPVLAPPPARLAPPLLARDTVPRRAAAARAIADRPTLGTRTTVQIAPGPHYAPRGSLHTSVLGRRYRALWATPIAAPVLDLTRFAGGLTPVRAGGDQQTRSLRFEAGDGREYNFRSIDKELTRALPDFMKETLADRIRQDQTSAQLPTAPVVATALLDAVGILNPGPRTVVLPDDPALGEFREEYAGMLGTIEVHPNEGEEEAKNFAGSVVVAGSERLIEHLYEDLDDRVDSRAFLAARLMDVLLGDGDRHPGQWRWARFDRDGLRWWAPVPEDRDYAFVHYDGALIALGRQLGVRRLVRFEPEYPDLAGMVDNSFDFTQRLLIGVPEEVWAEEALRLQAQLTDEVIRDAVATLPEAHYEIAGEELILALQGRRDRLPSMARDFYRIINEVPTIHGTRHADRFEARHLADGSVEVTLRAGDDPEVVLLSRTFDPDVTRELRVFLHEGDDLVRITGGAGKILVRAIGGSGDDEFEDLASAPAVFYDAEGSNRFLEGRRTRIDRRPWIGAPVEPLLPEEEEEEDEAADDDDPATRALVGDLLPVARRDWGSSSALFGTSLDWRGDAELLIGVGPTYTRYGFRHIPHATTLSAQLLYAPLHNRVGLEVDGEYRPSNSLRSYSAELDVTGLEATNFRGWGNDSPYRSADDARVWHRRARLRLGAAIPLHSAALLRLGAVAEHSASDLGPDRLVPIPEEERVRRLGVEAGTQLALGDAGVFPRQGVRAELEAIYYPVRTAATTTGRGEALVRAYLPLPLGRSVLALRAGGAAATGEVRFEDAAFLGGSRSLRGYAFERLAGERSVFGGAELRVPLTRANLIVRGDLGVSALADAGRVYVDTHSPGGWHTALGGSIWFATPVGALTATYAHGEESRYYLHLGLPY